MRRDGVAVTVARDEHDFVFLDGAESQRAGRFAIWGADHLAVGDFKIGQLGEAGTANDC